MPHGRYGKSRRETPWDDKPRTPTEQFLYEHYIEHYNQKHPKLLEAHEADMINSYVPAVCPLIGNRIPILAPMHDEIQLSLFPYRKSNPDFGAYA